MRKIALVVSVVAVLTFAASASFAGWSTFTPKGGQFTVQLPGTPKYTTAADKSPVGRIGEHIWSLDSGGSSFSIEYSDLPGIAVFFGGKKGIPKKAAKSFLANCGGKQTSAAAGPVGQNQGLVITYETTTSTGKAGFILLGKRLFVIQASVKKGGSQSAINQFWQTFKTN